MNVFISHSDDDRDFVAQLYQQIKSWGHNIWIAQANMPLGSVNRAVEWADVTIGLLTQAAIRNQQVLSAWNKTLVYGEYSNKQLLILKRDDSTAPHSFADTTWIDMSAENENKFAELKSYLSLATYDRWAPTQPIPLDDPYLDYLMHLYDKVEAQLDSLIHTTGTRRDASHDKPLMQPTFSDASGTLESFQAGVDNHSGRVVLLAEAGAGKTITLLRFVRDAVLERLNNPNCPLPIYAQILRWNVKQAPKLEYWLSAQCQLDPESIRLLIKNGAALLVLDGLDELAKRQSKDEQTPDPRQQFLDMLPENCSLLLSSSPEDYTQLGTSPTSTAIINLHPLSDTEIRAYLEFNQATAALWQVVHQYPDLLELLRAPLFLSMFAFAYRSTEQEAQQLQGKSDGDMRDAIFETYVTRRFQAEKNQFGGQALVPLQQVFTILGLVATRGVIRYGTGRVAMVQVNQPHWDDLLIIDDLRFGFMEEDSPYSSNFMAFAQQIGLITCPADGIGSCSFVHTLIRDLLVMKHCLPIAQNLDSYTIESLTRVSDKRKYAAFAEVLTGDYMLNYKLQAFAALENDKSELALKTLMTLSKTFEHEFFTDRIRESVARRLAPN